MELTDFINNIFQTDNGYELAWQCAHYLLGNFGVEAVSHEDMKAFCAIADSEIGPDMDELPYVKAVREIADSEGSQVFTVSAQIEEEIAQMDPEEKAEFGKLKLDECYIDIGAKSDEEAKKLVRVVDTAVYDTAVNCMGCKVVAPYMDNRVSCAILLAALAQMPEVVPNDVYFVFTVQEEVGLRGAKTAAYAVDPDYGIAVDVTDVDDTPGSEKNGTVQLGKGAAIKLMDSSVICHPEVVKILSDLSEEKKIAAQKDILRAGGTDAGAMQVSRMGVRAGGISVPCRYIHSPVEMTDVVDFKACVDLTVAYATAKLD
mgnify:CR=1 FL=1